MISSLTFVGCDADSLAELQGEEEEEEEEETTDEYNDRIYGSGGDGGFDNEHQAEASLVGQWGGPCRGDWYEAEYDDGDYNTDDTEAAASLLDHPVEDENDYDKESNREVIHFGDDGVGVHEELIFLGEGCVPENLMALMIMEFHYEVGDEIGEIQGARIVGMKIDNGGVIIQKQEVLDDFSETECGDAAVGDFIDYEAFGACEAELKAIEDAADDTTSTALVSEDNEDDEDGEGGGDEIGDEFEMAVKIDHDRLWFGNEDSNGNWYVDYQDELHRLTVRGSDDEAKPEYKDEFSEELENGSDGDIADEDVAESEEIEE
jgi:hypothetical protein